MSHNKNEIQNRWTLEMSGQASQQTKDNRGIDIFRNIFKITEGLIHFRNICSNFFDDNKAEERYFTSNDNHDVLGQR